MGAWRGRFAAFGCAHYPDRIPAALGSVQNAICFAASLDRELAREDDEHGYFTRAAIRLLRTPAGGWFKGTYGEFSRRVADAVQEDLIKSAKPPQHPTAFFVPDDNPIPARPFMSDVFGTLP